MSYALIILGLILLVVLHELGHFLAARMVGVRATKFYVFFPPALLKKKIGDVEYGIGALPLGGFVKLPGMFEPVPSEVAERVRWELETIQPRVVDGELKLRIDAVARQLRSNEDVEAIDAPLGELDDALAQVGATAAIEPDLARSIAKTRGRLQGLRDDVHPQAYWRAALWQRMTVIFAGPLVNLAVGFVVLAAFFSFLIPTFEVSEPISGKVEKGSPAERAGLTSGSEITGWNGPVVGSSDQEFTDRYIAARGKPVKVEWTTEKGAQLSETIVPQLLGDEESKRIGFSLDIPLQRTRIGYQNRGLGDGTHLALLEIRDITWGNIKGLAQVATDSKVRDEVGSVVGIVQFADDVQRASITVRYIGAISIILAVMNLLPLLPLDGGHLFFGLLEKLRRGRPMPRMAFERYSLIGIALVLLLFFIGLDNDIGRSTG